ncbi:MAG: hypothetical protein M0C28_08985 [Candidatus Moduliflexus flocculans]|nr:hypothetical protein [Candidatus Moduliflexus flocculans]
MSTKKQRRSDNFKDRKKKKSTRIAYLVAIIGGVVLLLVLFFVILFNALFPPVGMEALKKKEKESLKSIFPIPRNAFWLPRNAIFIKKKIRPSRRKKWSRLCWTVPKQGTSIPFPPCCPARRESG